MNDTYYDIDSALKTAYNTILKSGQFSQPRGKPVCEIVGARIGFDMRFPLVTIPSREIGHRFYAAEAYWILSGRNDLQYFMDRNMPFIWQFSDDGVFYAGAYGPRVVEQLTYVCDALANDRDTRQAVIEVWRPNPRPSRDIPCTIAYQFLARDGKLHCVQYMRSSDAWLGYPYDAFNATMLTAYILLLMRRRDPGGAGKLELGTHTLMAGSFHLYKENWDRAATFVEDDRGVEYAPFDPFAFTSPQDLLDYLDMAAASDEGIDPRKGGF